MQIDLTTPKTLSQVEKEMFVISLTRHQGSIADVAKELGISLKTAQCRLTKYGLKARSFRPPGFTTNNKVPRLSKETLVELLERHQGDLITISGETKIGISTIKSTCYRLKLHWQRYKPAAPRNQHFLNPVTLSAQPQPPIKLKLKEKYGPFRAPIELFTHSWKLVFETRFPSEDAQRLIAEALNSVEAMIVCLDGKELTMDELEGLVEWRRNGVTKFTGLLKEQLA